MSDTLIIQPIQQTVTVTASGNLTVDSIATSDTVSVNEEVTSISITPASLVEVAATPTIEVVAAGSQGPQGPPGPAGQGSNVFLFELARYLR